MSGMIDVSGRTTARFGKVAAFAAVTVAAVAVWNAGVWHAGTPGFDNAFECELAGGHVQSVDIAWHCESYHG